MQPVYGSPFAPSFGNDTLHPPIDGGLQNRVPTLSLLRNERAVKQNGKFLHLEFLFSGGGDGGFVRGDIGSDTRISTNNTIECSPPLEAGVGVGHDDGKEVTQLESTVNKQ